MKINIYYKEKLYLGIMIATSILIYGLLIELTLRSPVKFIVFIPIIIFYIFLYSVIQLFGKLFVLGQLRGNAIKVTEKQFPDIFKILKKQSQQLELNKIPDMYILEGGGLLNAFATRFFGQNHIVIFSDILSAAYKEGLSTVEFIIGHEMGHIKRNHLSLLKFLLLPAYLIFPLKLAYSRACEYTCDLIGYSLCPEGAEKGILLLAIGKGLSCHIIVSELLNEQNKNNFIMNFSEFFSTHPMLIKRLARINACQQQINFSPSKQNNEWDPLKKSPTIEIPKELQKEI